MDELDSGGIEEVPEAVTCKHSNGPLTSIDVGEILEQLRDY